MNLIDKVIEVFNPVAARERQVARMGLDAIKKSKSGTRGYEAASKGRRNALLALNSSSAKEVSKASRFLAAEAQEACRNNPLAKRIKMVWANSIVGKGINPEIVLVNKQKGKRAVELMDDWASSTACDYDGVMNLTGLQWLIAATVVETGGALVRFHIDKNLVGKNVIPLQLQIIEQTYLDKSVNDGVKVIDGIQYDSRGKIEGYWVLSEESGLNISGRQKSIFYRHGTEMVHVYWKQRPGQHLGVTWLAEVLTLLDKYNTLQDAVLMQQQIAACLGVLITDGTTPMGLEGQGTEERPDEIYPGSISYLKAGTDVNVVQPPKASDQGQFTMQIKNDIASGVNLTYAQLTTDYSKFNFASGRMGKNDFFETLDGAQHVMMLPSLTIIAERLTDLLFLQFGIDKVGITWAFPPRTMVNPKEDFDYIKDRVRSGTLSPLAACRMLGVKLEEVIDQWKESKALFGDLPFDIDPSVYSAAGNQLDDNDVASKNKQTKDDPDNAADQ